MEEKDRDGRIGCTSAIQADVAGRDAECDQHHWGDNTDEPRLSGQTDEAADDQLSLHSRL